MDDKRRKSEQREISFATGASSSRQCADGPHTPTSLAEAGALQAVACLVCSGHQGLGKTAVRKDGAIRRTTQTGPVAGEITVVLRGRTPPIDHGPCGTAQMFQPNVLLRVFVWEIEDFQFSRITFTQYSSAAVTFKNI